MSSPTPPPRSRDGWKLVGRVKGWMMVVTVVGMSAVSYFVADMLGGVLRENKITPSDMGALFLRAPWVVAVLSIPALAACAPLVRGTDRAMRWMTISTVLALIPLGFFLLGAVGCVAAIYSSALGR